MGTIVVDQPTAGAVAERCALTDLLPDQCGCKQHRDSPALDAIVDYNDYRIAKLLTARFDGRCALNPAHQIGAGDEIGAAVDARSSEVGWVCERCVREIRS